MVTNKELHARVKTLLKWAVSNKFDINVTWDKSEVRVSQQWECPLDCSDYYPAFLNLLKGYEFGTRELDSKDGEILDISDICDSLDEVELNRIQPKEIA